MSESISGYFLSFNDEESKIIEELLEDEGYEVNSEGIKKYLLDIALDSGPEETDKKSNIEKIITENPDIINTGINIAKSLYDTIQKKGR